MHENDKNQINPWNIWRVAVLKGGMYLVGVAKDTAGRTMMRPESYSALYARPCCTS